MSEEAKKRKPYPSVFRLARRDAAVRVEIDSEEIRRLRPAWSEAQARSFVLRKQQTIAAAMLAAGWSAIAHLMQREKGACDEHQDRDDA